MRILNVLRLYPTLNHEQVSSLVVEYDKLSLGVFHIKWSSKTGMPMTFVFTPEQTAQLKEALNNYP